MARDADELVDLSRELTRRLQARTLENAAQGLDGSVDGGTVIACDLVETEDAYHLIADVPGVTADGIEVNVVGRRLTLRVTRTEEDPAGRHPIMVERQVGTLTRTLELPADIREDAVQARLSGGVLSVRLEKSGSGETARDG